MTSPAQATNRPRAPLAELPLHHFVSQSLASSSPKSSPGNLLKTPSRSRSRSPSLSSSRNGSVSVSPHKQALLQNHRFVREGSAASPSSSSTTQPLEQVENMTDADLAVLPLRLFADPPSSKTAGSDLSLEASPIVPRSSAGPMESRFSPRNVKNLAHHSRPSTPKGATTTPLNVRQHRPPHTSGPKPAQFVEPSPTTQRMSQRMSEPRLSRRGVDAPEEVPATPSRARVLASPAAKARSQDLSAPINAAKEQGSGTMTPLQVPTHLLSLSNNAPQSLPKKKHRVSQTEIAIAHEEAGAGPIASPSPRKMTDYFSPAFFGSSDDANKTRLRTDSISNPLLSMQDLMSKSSVNSLTLTKSGLFLGVVARPIPGWTVHEDSPLSSCDTAPSQDHPPSEVESPVQSVQSTPNKENRTPDASFLTGKVVPLVLPDRAYSVDVLPLVGGSVSPGGKKRSSSRLTTQESSPAGAVGVGVGGSRKKGTGGRLSLLADADAELEVDEELGKKTKGTNQQNSPLIGRRKSSASQHQSKISARSSRKSSSVYGAGEVGEGIASRTRSRTRV